MSLLGRDADDCFSAGILSNDSPVSGGYFERPRLSFQKVNVQCEVDGPSKFLIGTEIVSCFIMPPNWGNQTRLKKAIGSIRCPSSGRVEHGAVEPADSSYETRQPFDSLQCPPSCPVIVLYGKICIRSAILV